MGTNIYYLCFLKCKVNYELNNKSWNVLKLSISGSTYITTITWNCLKKLNYFVENTLGILNYELIVQLRNSVYDMCPVSKM